MLLTGYPSKVLPKLESTIQNIVERDEIEEFYIGRTDDLVATKSRHGCDEIIPLYETSTATKAIIVEDELTKNFYEDDKCSNDSSGGGGGASDLNYNYVYLATWYH